MKNVLKRSLSLLLAIAIIFSSAYVGLGEVDFSGLFVVKTQAASKMTLSQLRTKFPAGKYWNHAGNPGASNSVNNQDGYTSTPCSKHGVVGTSQQTCNGFQPGSTQLSWQCMGYAEKLGYDFTGYNPRNNANGWYTYKSSSALDSLKPGDIVRYKNDNHSIFVTAVSGNTVTYTDCNSDGHCIIRWGATISKSTLKSSFTHVRSAPYSLDDSYTLSIKYDANGGVISGSDKTYNIYSVETSSGVNMRSGAGTSYSVLQTVPIDATFYVTSTATANGYTWGKTTYNGKTGWVVISEDWTKKIGTRPQTKYYLNSSDVVYKSSNKKVMVQEMVQGTTYEDGLYNASTFGISRTGYTFGGWGTTASGGTIHNQSVSQTAEKLCASVKNGNQTITLYAYWIPNTLSVYFNANGGSISSDTYKLSSSVVYNKSDSSKYAQKWTYNNEKENGLTNASTLGLYKTGYTFAGWGTKASGGTIYSQGDNTLVPTTLNSSIKTGNCSITLYAQWVPNTLSVYYNANGASISSDTYKLSSNVVYNKSDSTKSVQKWTYNQKKTNGLVNVSTFGLYKTGYTFVGWGTSSSGGTIFDQDNVDLLPTSINSNIKNGSCSITLYAQWVPNTLTVYHNANGGSISSDTYKLSSNVVCYKSDSTKFTHKWTYNEKQKNGLTNIGTFGLYRTGYDFVGWGTSSSGGTIFDQNDVDLVPTTINANIKNGNCSTTLYAIWQIKTYTVKYNANGGVGAPANQTKTYGTSLVLSSTVPTREGYVFLGWSTNANDVTATYTAGGTYTQNASCTLYAVWKAEDELHSYTIEQIVTEPTCTTAGVMRFCCSEHSDCGMYKEVEIPAKGHEYGEWEIVTHPTCTSSGTKAQKCICGDAKTESIEPLEHNYSEDWIIDIDPTCTEAGSQSHHCIYCGDKIDVTEVNANGHNYVWVNDFENSSKTGTCSVCGNVSVEPIVITDILTFTLNSTNTGYIVTDCVSDYVGDIEIPYEFDGLPVTAIGADAFRDCTGINSVIIPDSVTSIGGSAFRGCTNLTEIDLPDNITSIPGAMCYGCAKLEAVIIPEGVVNIGGYAFGGCTALKTAVIPDSVTNVGGSVFVNSKSLVMLCSENSSANTYATDNGVKCIFNTENTRFDLLTKIIYTDVLGGDLGSIMSNSDTITYTMNTPYAGTSAVVDVMKDGTLHSQYTLVVNGDTNGDSVCDVLDCFDVERASNGNADLSDVYAEAGDTNGDGVIDIADYQAIVNKAVS